MLRLTHYALALTVVLIAGCTSAPKHHHTMHIQSEAGIPVDAQFQLAPLASEKLLFRGTAKSAVAEDNYGMVYMGDAGIVGLIAGIATHAALESNLQNSEARRAQDLADKALEPFLPSLKQLGSTYSLESLVNHPALTEDNTSQSSLYLSLHPIFFITDDHSTLTLKNIVSVHQSSRQESAIYQNMIEVVSVLPKELENAPVEKQLEVFKEITQQQLSESVTLGLKDAMNHLSPNEAMQTFRYSESGKYSYERASLIEKTCTKVVIRTLRKWIKSRPIELFPDIQDTQREVCAGAVKIETLSETKLTAFRQAS